MKSAFFRLTLLFLAVLSGDSADAAGNWPQFRGPHASGVAEGDAPLTWNLDTGENVRWQVPVPGLAHASPILS